MSVWIHPKTITGDAATGERYFRREYINENFWREVAKGNHLLFVAPRRVGKTSVMKDLVSTAPANYTCIYQNVEGVKTKQEFYKRLFEIFIECVGKVAKAKNLLGKWSRKYGVDEVSKSGIKIREKELDYEAELRNLIPDLKTEGIHTVLFLDEFAEVISKLIRQGKTQDAIDILHTLREIRGDERLSNFTLVFAGSVGLHYVIKSMDRPKLINDLHPVQTGALDEQEAKALIHMLAGDATIQLSPESTGYLLQKVHHLLPYYLQLMLEEIDLIAEKASEPHVSSAFIDAAFTNVLKKNKNFDDWLERLRTYQQSAFAFTNTILKHCAHQGHISVQQVYNTALDPAHNRADDYMDYVEQLETDGYLVETEDGSGIYRFISPFLQHFWKRKFPVYHG